MQPEGQFTMAPCRFADHEVHGANPERMHLSISEKRDTKLSMPGRSGVVDLWWVFSNGSCDIRWCDTWQMATKEMKYLGCVFFLTDLFFVYHIAEELWILVCHFRECHELSHSLRGVDWNTSVWCGGCFWFKGLKGGLNGWVVTKAWFAWSTKVSWYYSQKKTWKNIIPHDTGT